MTIPNGNIRLPRSVLVAPDALYHAILGDTSSVELLEDADAMVIPQTAKPRFQEERVALLRELLSDSDQLAAGVLLIRNPYETASYEHAAQAIEVFTSAKFHALANLSRLLGATAVEFREAKVELKNSKWRAGLGVDVPAFGADAKASKEMSKKIEKHITAEMTFPGSAPAIDEATKYIARRNLSNDQQMNDLVDLRTGENPIGSYKVTLNGTRESAANFKSALKIANAGPLKAIDVGASFKMTVDSMTSIRLVTEITF